MIPEAGLKSSSLTEIRKDHNRCGRINLTELENKDAAGGENRRHFACCARILRTFYMKKTVVVGMSGGVDSSVAAYLLKEQGYNVIGVTMQIWQDGQASACAIPSDSYMKAVSRSCCGIEAADDARAVCEAIGIPFYVMDFQKEFREHVIDYFVNDYIQGRTPNPCIACNRYVKWEALLTRARMIGADYMATGHYARVHQLPWGRWCVSESATARKDQTYALYNLTQEQLAHTLMPVGDYHKDQVREIAREQNLPVAEKPESMDICFVPDGNYAGYIDRYRGVSMPAGNFVDREGHVLGRHRGITHYTIGQRRGLGLALKKPQYVTDIRPATNEVVIGDNDDLMSSDLTVSHVNAMAADHFEKGQRMRCKIRYSHRGEMATVTDVITETSGNDNSGTIVRLHFDSPVRAATPGQSAVFYSGHDVLGGGIIEK